MKATAIVVDDERNILNLFKRILTVDELRKIRSSDPSSRLIEEVTLYTYESAEEALASHTLDSADVVVSDLAMAGIDGLEFLRQVRTTRPDLPFIILTGVGTIEDAVESIKLGAFDFVTKPFQRDEVLLSISKAINFSLLQHENRLLRLQLRPDAESVVADPAGSSGEAVAPLVAESQAVRPEPTEFVLYPDQREWLRLQISRKQSLRDVVDMATTIMEAALIREVLENASGNRAEAARQLGISRVAFYRKIKEYGLDE